MSTHYQHFKELRSKVLEKNKEDNSERTLRYYQMLSEMLEREDLYGDSFTFLHSVFDYIEQNEYITENQIAIIDKIQSHPDIPDDEIYNSSPF